MKNAKSRTPARKRNSPNPSVQQAPPEFSAKHEPDAKLTRTETRVTTHAGPLPSPEDFAYYNQTLPNAAERIMAMAEKQQQSRAKGQDRVLANDRLRILGAVLFDIGLLAVVITAIIHNNTIVAVLGLGGVITFVLQQIRDWLKPRK